jgi:chromosome segregation ATPase
LATASRRPIGKAANWSLAAAIVDRLFRACNITRIIAALAAVSAKSSTLSVVSEELRGPLEDLSAGHAEFQVFFTGVCEELETLAAELVRRQQSWQTEQGEREAELELRAARLKSERSEVASEWERVQVLAERSRSDSIAVGEENGQQVKSFLEEARHERSALQDALEVAQSQSAQLAEVVSELSHTRSELTEVRQEIKHYPEQLGAARGEDANPTRVAELEEKVHQLEQERAELNQERAVLETELESVRNRAAELSEGIAQERRQMSDERTEWTAELKRMRRMLETFAQRQIELAEAGVGGQAQTSGGTDENPPSETAKDPVLDSVMAQFEMLQKDLAKRRKSTAKSGAKASA